MNFLKNLSRSVGLLLLAMSCWAQPGTTNPSDVIKYPHHFKYEGNPLSRLHSATDPNVQVWNDTVWMYCSQDHQVVNGDMYATMDGYHVFSSADMINWTDHGEIIHSRDIDWGVDGFMWAPAAAHRNGKYYLYYPHIDKKNEWRVGVAIGDRPYGPFKDIGHPIEGITGTDPAIFVDDDGEAYIYNGSHVVAKLKPNMIELAEPIRVVDYAPLEILDDDLQRFHEGSFMHKKDGKYYFSYTNFKHAKYGGWYAMGDSPYGPFEWKGPMAPSPKGAQDHHSIIEFKGQWYYFYHISVPDFPAKREGHGRIACFDRLFYNNDGTIQMVVHTTGPTKTLNITAPNGSVLLNPPGGAYAAGTKVTLHAVGDLGFAFNQWGGDLSGSVNPVSIVVDTDKHVSASFKSTPTYRLSVNSKNGTVILDPPGGVYNSGTNVSLVPVKDFGYKFSYWTGDLAGSKKPEIIHMNSNKVVTANYGSVPTYKIVSSAPNGIIELDPPGGMYEKGTVVSVSAKNDYGYKFSGWSNNLSGMNHTATLQMDSDKQITASFSYVGDSKIVFATNCGGADFRSEEGVYYQADNNFNGGGTYSSGNKISGTMDAALYQKERHGNEFGYTLALPNDNYKVVLMFAEIFHESAGRRVFDVYIEGVKVSNDLDICAKVGKDAAYLETHAVSLRDGILNISFTAKKDMAKISAIKVVLPDRLNE